MKNTLSKLAGYLSRVYLSGTYPAQLERKMQPGQGIGDRMRLLVEHRQKPRTLFDLITLLGGGGGNHAEQDCFAELGQAFRTIIDFGFTPSQRMDGELFRGLLVHGITHEDTSLETQAVVNFKNWDFTQLTRIWVETINKTDMPEIKKAEELGRMRRMLKNIPKTSGGGLAGEEKIKAIRAILEDRELRAKVQGGKLKGKMKKL